MKIQLSDHFTYKKLLRFTMPSIVMMIFTSVYNMVDGLFISNFVGITPFAAINLIFPFIQIVGCFGFMFASGGSALVSATLGAREPEKANRIFSLLTYSTVVTGIIVAVLSIALIRPIAIWMGADAVLLPYCVTYSRIVLAALPCFMLQILFQSFLVTAEKPGLGLMVTVIAGVTNIILDALFVAVLRWGVVGAATATVISQCAGGLIPLVYFLRKNNSLLKLGKTRLQGRVLLNACTNGLSELVTNISMSVVSILYNFRLMVLVGEDGVASYGAVMYVGFVFVAVFLGYAIGSAPVIGFHFGAQNHGELKSLFRKSNWIVVGASVLLAAFCLVLADPLARVFVGSDPALLDMTASAFRFYSLTVLFSGFPIFGSAFFTALNNGVVSATISFMRTIVFQIGAVLILPIFWGLDGVWLSLAIAEILATIVSVLFYKAKRKIYHY